MSREDKSEFRTVIRGGQIRVFRTVSRVRQIRMHDCVQGRTKSDFRTVTRGV